MLGPLDQHRDRGSVRVVERRTRRIRHIFVRFVGGRRVRLLKLKGAMEEEGGVSGWFDVSGVGFEVD